MPSNVQKEHLLPSEALTRFHPPEIQNESESIERQTIFSFRVGNLGFLIPSSIHCEIIEKLPVNPLPNVEAWFCGLLNLRGNLVPVIDLTILFNLDQNDIDSKKRQLFAIDQGDKAMAFWIDGLPEIQQDFSTPLKQLPPLPSILQRCVLGGYLQSEQIWLNVRFDELFKLLGRGHTTDDTEL